MTTQELFVKSNEVLASIINQIKDDQWDIDMPEGSTRESSTVKQAVRYHTYDDAWVPDTYAGKTIAEVGDKYDYLKDNDDVMDNYIKFNKIANDTISNFSDLSITVHYTYGDFVASEGIPHLISFRAARAYDIASAIGVEYSVDDDYAQALIDTFSPVIESYRQMGVFPPAKEVSENASVREKMLAMFGRG
jgi:hypothetical protein